MKRNGAEVRLDRKAAECRADFERSFAQDNFVLKADQCLSNLVSGRQPLDGEREQDDVIALFNLHILRLHRQLGRMLQVTRTIRWALAGPEWNTRLCPTIRLLVLRLATAPACRAVYMLGL
jgi:hypothetical protein